MRNEKHLDVDVHQRAIRAAARTGIAQVVLQGTFEDKPKKRGFLAAVLPHQETRIMAEEAAKSSGLFLPYPLLGFLLTLTMAMVAGLVGLYSQLSTMQTTMILRDSSYQQQVKELKEKVDLQGMYITDLREKQIRADAEAAVKRKGG